MLKSIAVVSRFVLLWLLCPVVAIASFRFVFGGVAVTMPDFLYHATLRPVAFYSHIVLASVALVLVPVQVWPGLREKRLQLHRISGRIYALSILASGIGGLFLAISTKSGAVAAWGFGLLAMAWLGTTLYGVLFAMAGNLAAHRRWMIRSAALTMAAVTLRIQLGLFVLAGYSYDDVTGVLAWGCWVPNLLVAELLLRRSRPGNRRLHADAGMPAGFPDRRLS